MKSKKITLLDAVCLIVAVYIFVVGFMGAWNA